MNFGKIFGPHKNCLPQSPLSKQISPAASPSTLRRQSAASNVANASASSPSSWFMAWNPLGKKPFLTARPTLSQGLASHLEDREGEMTERC